MFSTGGHDEFLQTFQTVVRRSRQFCAGVGSRSAGTNAFYAFSSLALILALTQQDADPTDIAGRRRAIRVLDQALSGFALNRTLTSDAKSPATSADARQPAFSLLSRRKEWHRFVNGGEDPQQLGQSHSISVA